jgi:hypothetical protein
VATGQCDDWQKINEAIRALYTMEDERQIFDALVTRRLPREEERAREPEQCGSVELF